MQIRNQRLYRATHKTFEAYCRDRLDISRIHAHRLCTSAHVANNLLPMGNISLPSNERQARILTPLNNDPETQQAVWREVLDTMPSPIDV